MKEKLLIMFYLAAVFFAAFVVTTSLTDAMCRHNGYYDEGVQDERAVFGY